MGGWDESPEEEEEERGGGGVLPRYINMIYIWEGNYVLRPIK